MKIDAWTVLHHCPYTEGSSLIVFGTSASAAAIARIHWYHSGIVRIFRGPSLGVGEGAGCSWISFYRSIFDSMCRCANADVNPIWTFQGFKDKVPK